MKKILVLGGTGAMGKHLVEILSALGEQVSVTTRGIYEPKKNINFIQGNAREDTFLEDVLAYGWDVIVDFMYYNNEVFKGRSCKLLASCDHYIFLSSARVYSDAGEKIKESTPRLLDSISDRAFLSTDDYSLAKARQENVLQQSGKKNYTIIRPYITYSEERLQLGVLEKEEWLYRALKGRSIVFSKEIADKLTTLTYGEDVAKSIVALIRHTKASGEVYHVTQEKTASWNEILEIYLKAVERKCGERPKVIFVGRKNFLKIKNAEYQIKYDRLFNREFDNRKINQFIDISSFHDLGNGLRGCIENFLENPQFKSINWVSEAKKDKYTGENTNLNEIPSWKLKVKYLLYRYLQR